jgi:hypothetical protein
MRRALRLALLLLLAGALRAHTAAPRRSLTTAVKRDAPQHSLLTVNQTCPRLFFCNVGTSGLGDQLEHFVYCMYVAKLLGATMIVEGFQRGPTSHHGHTEYRQVAELLGIDFGLTLQGVQQTYPGLQRVELNMPQALELHALLANGTQSATCNTLFVSDLNGCPVINWCDAKPEYDSLKATLWFLRRNNARSACFDAGLGFPPAVAVNMAWHVRTGDICLRCNDVAYYTRLFTKLEAVIGARINLVFESQSEVAFLKNEPLFKDAVFVNDGTLMQTVCRFLTADVLITSGSALSAFTAAFAPPWSPIVIEERRKEAPERSSSVAHHFFDDEEAILLEDGQPLLSDFELASLFQSILKGSRRPRRHFTPPPPSPAQAAVAA